MLKHLATLFVAFVLPGLVMADDTCTALFDFGQPEATDGWRSVNDTVMGGRSRGSASYGDSAMLFSGIINTDGGGFASVRARLPAPGLAGANAIRLRIKPDARTYQVSIQTNVRFRGRPVAYRATIRTLTVGEWSEPTVFFSELTPTVFGQRVNAPVFNPDNASVISLYVNDGLDGPFELVVGEISRCAI
ncbi:MAG: CIA30 family protein [Pseudomonadota bacterium]